MKSLVRLSTRITSIALFIGLIGCGSDRVRSEPLSANTLRGPRGGTSIPIEGGLGYCEAKLESTPKRRGGSESPAELAVYFYGPDGKTALAALPSSVFATITAADGNSDRRSKTVALVAKPKPGDPSTAGRFAAEIGTQADSDLRGKLEISLSGKNIKIPLNVH